MSLSLHTYLQDSRHYLLEFNRASIFEDLFYWVQVLWILLVSMIVMSAWGKYEKSTNLQTYGMSNMYEVIIIIKILKQAL